MCLLQFEDKEKITLWYNKVGPYNNPQETYQYFDLPFCRPDGAAARLLRAELPPRR
jgi:transmembrane 9 superfamily protein 3